MNQIFSVAVCSSPPVEQGTGKLYLWILALGQLSHLYDFRQVT